MQDTKHTLKLQILNCSVTRRIRLALHTLRSGVVSEWVIEKNQFSSTSSVSTRFQILGQPWLSKFYNPLSNNLPRTVYFLIISQKIHPSHVWNLCWEGHRNPNTHFFTQFCENFFIIKMVVSWVCTGLRTKRIPQNIPLNESTQLFINVYTWQFNI